jgi:predicted dehydrogenase
VFGIGTLWFNLAFGLGHWTLIHECQIEGNYNMAYSNRRKFLQSASGAIVGLWVGNTLGGPRINQTKKKRDKIKIGQIGTAHPHADGKMSTLRKLRDDYEVVGLVEADNKRTQNLDEAYKDIPLMTEEQLLNYPGLKAVAVETAVRDLLPVGLKCIKAGKHIHLDKPAGEELSLFKHLLNEATQRGLTVQMGYMFRGNPAFQFCFNAVKNGWLGEVFEVDGVMGKVQSVKNRQSMRKYRGGAMFDLGGHLIDALVIVAGKPDKVTPYTRYIRTDLDDLPDNQLAVFEYKKATATIRSSFVEVEGQHRRQFVVCGEEGTIEIRPLDSPRVLLALSKDLAGYKKGYQEVELPATPGRYDIQLIDFAKIIREEKESEYSPAHDLAVQEALLRACGLPLS